MADITNNQACVYLNDTIRPICNQIAQLYYFCQVAQQRFVAQGLTDLIPNDPTAILVDGRTDVAAVSGADVATVLGYAQQIIALLTENSNQNLTQILKIAINPMNPMA